MYLKLSLDADIMFMYLKYHIFNDQCYSIMSRAIMAFDHVHLKLSLSNDGLIAARVILSHQSRLFYIKSGISNWTFSRSFGRLDCFREGFCNGYPDGDFRNDERTLII